QLDALVTELKQVIRRLGFSILMPPLTFPFLFSFITPDEYCIDSGRCSKEITSATNPLEERILEEFDGSEVGGRIILTASASDS
ncbi:hypothetical protein CDAR_190041, partial [Caerostris darwini]